MPSRSNVTHRFRAGAVGFVFSVFWSPVMRPCPSPLENLAAFAIAFFSGVMSVISISSYLRRTLNDRADGGS